MMHLYYRNVNGFTCRQGLTLTAARLVVFAELDWTPGTLEQCEDRAHRIGQQQAVHVHYLVARGTLDDWVWSALARKVRILNISVIYLFFLVMKTTNTVKSRYLARR